MAQENGVCVHAKQYIDRNNKVVIVMQTQLRDALSEWHLIYSGGSLHLGRPHFKFEENLSKYILNTVYEQTSFQKNS